jgi:hypothetical protein|tara:strand:+ start:2356 stop:2565 length:210 start_codon:yes stop_codon:yes gene_type:complete
MEKPKLTPLELRKILDSAKQQRDKSKESLNIINVELNQRCTQIKEFLLKPVPLIVALALGLLIILILVV